MASSLQRYAHKKMKEGCISLIEIWKVDKLHASTVHLERSYSNIKKSTRNIIGMFGNIIISDLYIDYEKPLNLC